MSSCTGRRASHLALPPAPHPIGSCSQGLSVTLSLFPSVSFGLSWFWCPYIQAFCPPTFSIPRPPSEFPWLTLTALALPVCPVSLCPRLSVSAAVSPSLSLPPALSQRLIPWASTSHLLPQLPPLTPGSGHRNRVPAGDVEEEPLPFPPLPRPHLLRGAAGLRGWAVGRTLSGLGDPPSAARARPLSVSPVAAAPPSERLRPSGPASSGAESRALAAAERAPAVPARAPESTRTALTSASASTTSGELGCRSRKRRETWTRGSCPRADATRREVLPDKL